MANSRSHGPSSHARLHKRGNSASSMTSALSPVSDHGTFIFNRSETPKVTYEEPWKESWKEPTRPMHAATSHQLKIKPYLRKLSSKDTNALDLSRPAAENGGLTGLGILEYDNSNNGAGASDSYFSRSVSDVNFAPVNSRNRHARSTSNTSQFSTASSLQRPTAPYMPSIRQTPRPYTPPMSKSTPSSVLGSENEGDDNIMSDEEFRLRQNAFDSTRRSGSLSSTPNAAPGLRIHTTGSSTRLAGSYSQSSISLTSPIAQSRSRGDTLRSVEAATSPSSRTSFDRAFGFIRGGRDSPVDPASRAASIRAARQAFQEKEEAKERKHDREAHKQAERDIRKQNKKDERERRKSESQEKKRARSISDSNEKTSRPSIGGRQYSDHREPHSSTLPNHVTAVEPEKRGGGVMPKVTKSRKAKGRWLRFVTWFKTRLLRMSRRLHVGS